MSYSVLFPGPGTGGSRKPPCWEDLRLDRFLEPIIGRESRFDLSPCFFTPLTTEDQVFYRQEILKDLRKGENLRILDEFSQEICHLSELEARAGQELRESGSYLVSGHILDYGERYVRCIEGLCRRLPDMDLRSRGLMRGAELLLALRDAPPFRTLVREQEALRARFDSLRYCMHIRYGTVRVKKYEGEEDLSRKILSVFRKFRREDGKDYRQDLKEVPYADHVEAALLQCLSRVYPQEFDALSAYTAAHARFIPREVLQFCREIRFYVDWLRFLEPLENQGLPFCFPDFQNDGVSAGAFFDLALADRIGSRVVKNDLVLQPGEKLVVITGPNQGGKTTFARALGQLHYLASLGLCVPGTSARLRLTDQVLTHFQQEDAPGRLRDDLCRLRSLLDAATDRSLLVINEIFSSTTARDAVRLGKQMLAAIPGCLTVLVTFLSELAEEGAVSMMSTVDPRDPSVRTFRIVRKPPDGRTYAMTLAQAHGLTREQIRRRLKP